MNDETDLCAVLAENPLDRLPVPHVDVVVGVVRVLLQERVPLPPGRRVRAEEVAAHVVVDTDHEVPAAAVELNGLGTDQTGGARDEDG